MTPLKTSLFLTPDRPASNRKRGRPKKEETQIEPVEWTIDMIRALLQQNEELKVEFLDVEDKVSLALGWSKIVLHIHAKFNVEIISGQESKYQLLRKTHSGAYKQTENASNRRSPFTGKIWSPISEGEAG